MFTCAVFKPHMQQRNAHCVSASSCTILLAIADTSFKFDLLRSPQTSIHQNIANLLTCPYPLSYSIRLFLKFQNRFQVYSKVCKI